jgi:hypothetical protein
VGRSDRGACVEEGTRQGDDGDRDLRLPVPLVTKRGPTAIATESGRIATETAPRTSVVAATARDPLDSSGPAQ